MHLSLFIVCCSRHYAQICAVASSSLKWTCIQYRTLMRIVIRISGTLLITERTCNISIDELLDKCCSKIIPWKWCFLQIGICISSCFVLVSGNLGLWDQNSMNYLLHIQTYKARVSVISVIFTLWTEWADYKGYWSNTLVLKQSRNQNSVTDRLWCSVIGADLQN